MKHRIARFPLLAVALCVATALPAQPTGPFAPLVREAVAFATALRQRGELPSETGGAAAKIAISGVPSDGKPQYPVVFRLVVTPPGASYQLIYSIRKASTASGWELLADPPKRAAIPARVDIALPQLRTELLARRDADQAVRRELRGGPDDAEVARRMKAIDAENTTRLKKILEEHGWPTPALVGLDGANAAFLIVQHSPDATFQEEMLPVIEAEYRAGRLPGSAFALLKDRTLVRKGLPQVYGSQVRPVEQWKDGQPEPLPLEDPENVDERRAEVGLPPLAEYLAGIKSRYFPAK